MDLAFIKVLNMSVSASWLVLIVLVLRLLLKKSPKWISVVLWALVAVRLICPFSLESSLSLIPEKTTKQMVVSISGGYYGDAMVYSQGSSQYDAAVSAGVMPSVGDNGYQYVITQRDNPTKPVQTTAVLYGQIWPAGMLGMLAWALISYSRLRRKVAPSIDVGNGVYICDYIDTPFILGIGKPKIYLPSALEPDAASHVLAHERAHIARKDHWWKPLGYLLLSIHWFNPLLWLAYILLCRDIELACDEKVIRDMESPQKKAYSEALLSCSVNRRQIAACPLAFGEVGVKERVRTVLNYKKPAFWIVLLAVIALIVTAVCFLTDPSTEEPQVTGESPYGWTSTVGPWDIQKAWAYPYTDAAYFQTLEGSKLDELLHLLNEVKEDEIVARVPSGMDDPLWNLDAANVYLFCDDGMTAWLHYADNTLIIGTETDSNEWNVDGYWVIENENLIGWIQKIANGGTWMLSDENREEICWLLRMEQVQFFDPWEYEDLLFVGCAYDNGRGLGVAVFEPLAEGYKLLKLIRDEDVKRCASGDQLYYCDYGDLRIFLVLNRNITGMEWAGAYESAYAIETHPGLVVEYFPEELDTMYRFNYGGGATTLYMDGNNQTHAQPPEYSNDAFANLDDAYSVCSNLKLSDVVYAWACDAEKVDAGHDRAIVKDLTDNQMVQLINLLHGLPETAFEKAEYPTEGNRWLNLFMEEPLTAPYLELKLHEDNVYFRVYTDLRTTHQDWKIHSDELKTFLESFYGGDTSDWDRFAPYPVADGEITFYTNGVEMTIPNYLYFRYEQTDDGIRFKPEGQSGWVLLKAVPGPLEIDSDNLKSQKGIKYGHEAQWAYRENAQVWRYMNVTIPYGDGEYYVLLLNEDEAAWVGDFDYHIDIQWVLDNLVIQDNG